MAPPDDIFHPFLHLQIIYTPIISSRGCRGAGRARREPSAIVGSKKRVRVPNFGLPEIVAQIGQRTANIGISMGYVDNLSQNQLFVVNIIRKSRDTFMSRLAWKCPVIVNVH